MNARTTPELRAAALAAAQAERDALHQEMCRIYGLTFPLSEAWTPFWERDKERRERNRTIFERIRMAKDAIWRFDVESTAHLWERWSDVAVKWANAIRDFAALGGQVEYWCGVPHSASAIPLTFGLYTPEGDELPCKYRLKDIRAAIAVLQSRSKEAA